MSVFSLISQAGWMGKTVLLLLFGGSILGWTIIIQKWKLFKSIQSENKHFLDAFWSSKNMGEVLDQSTKYRRAPLYKIFESAMVEFEKFSGGGNSAHKHQTKSDNLTRVIIRASNDEILLMEQNLSWLATLASSAPFVGLFGTVWGIMASFQGIGAMGNASLAVVAPGISEALIATAAGLIVAIPSAIFYNLYIQNIKKVVTTMENFQNDFLNIVNRSQSHDPVSAS